MLTAEGSPLNTALPGPAKGNGLGWGKRTLAPGEVIVSDHNGK